MDRSFGYLADFSLLDVLMLARLAALLEYRAVDWIKDLGLKQPPSLFFLQQGLPKSTRYESEVLATYFSDDFRTLYRVPHQSATIEQCIVRDCERRVCERIEVNTTARDGL